MPIRRGDLTGRFGYPQVEMLPETEYIIFAYGWEQGHPTTDIVYEFVTTTEAKQSDMTFELLYNGYYAGAEVQEAWPDNFTSDISGHAVYHLKAQCTPEDREVYKYYAIYEGNCMDESYLSDEWIKEELITNGSSWDTNMLLIKYDTEYIIVGYAIDIAGNPTAVCRELLNPTEDGTVPMGGFNPNELWNWGDEASSSAAGIVSGDGWMMPLIAK